MREREMIKKDMGKKERKREREERGIIKKKNIEARERRKR